MAKTLEKAFAEDGIKVEYRGVPAKILPIDNDMKNNLEGDDAASAEVGQLIVAWNEDGERRGAVLNLNAGNDIRLLVDRNENDPEQIFASNMRAAASQIITLRNEARWNREAVAAENVKAREDYNAAVARGEVLDEPVEKQPIYTETAFDRFPRLINCCWQGIDKALADPFTSIEERSEAYCARYEIGRANSNVLSPEEMEKINTARALREEIADIHQGDSGPYEGSGEASYALVDELPISGRGFSEVQMRALVGNRALSEDLFGVLTRTPMQDLIARHLSPADLAMAKQVMARNEEKVWSPDALERINTLLGDRMPGYKLQANFYTKDGADVLLIRDHVGAYLYSWDSDSRVEEVNLEDLVMSTYTKDDVPTDEEIHELRVSLNELRYDSGEEINFNFDADEDDLEFEDGLMDENDIEDPFDISSGPTA